MRQKLGLWLIGAGSLLVLGVTGYLLFNLFLGAPGPAPLPGHVAGYTLARHAFGQAAIDEITQMHGKAFSLTSGAVGIYGAQGQATLWVSGTGLPFIAGRLVEAMRERIAEGRSPFTPLGGRQEDGRTVYELEGHGQKHFYWQSGRLVVWLAADFELAEQALAEMLDFYP